MLFMVIHSVYLSRIPLWFCIKYHLDPSRKPFWKWLLLLHHLTSGFCLTCRVSRARCAPCCQRTLAPRWLCRGNAAPKASLDPRGSARGACLWVQRSSVNCFRAVMRVRVQRWIISVWNSNLEGDMLFLIILFTSRLRLCTSFTFWSSSRNKPDIMSKVDSRRKKVI